MKTIIIGGGPAGMLAAISAKKQKNEVILLEKMHQLGKKLSITGKGRCNITSSLETTQEFIDNIPGNGRFLYSALKNFDNDDIIELLGIPVKEERGHRIFPKSDKASDVVEALKNKLDGVRVITDIKAEEIIVNNGKVEGVKTDKGIFKADKVVLATGGKSYPQTGSTGDGYKIAKQLGHTIIETKPSLIAMTMENESLKYCTELQGLSLRNVRITIYESNTKVYEDFGEMIFTNFGISGPIVLSASAHLVRTKLRNAKIEIDLKPALSEQKLNDRVLRDFEKYKNKELKNSLNDLLPRKIIPVIIERSRIDQNKKVNEITKQERQKIIKLLKCFELEIKGFRPIKEAIITRGGVSTKEINPKTMESKLVKGLFFAGEIIDVDAYTGGFNLQIAYSTGFTAGLKQE
ncbi:MAG: NAD(P)/FAD-dependent oxidoreductase [Clostridia bacterium]|nr:NAD(P)/FAD-dependent oxidoreductase [Clostridia bacterium]